MASTNDFFLRKREWSEIKDGILGAYLRPYMAKISHTRKAVRIADCFAGKGRFQDGKDGSPIIIRDAIHEQLKHTPQASIEGVFIENKYIDDLRHNLKEDTHVHVLEGDYEERMEYFIAHYAARDKNIFLYVDPYGIKSLKLSHFKAVASMPFHTIEILLNFNACGFLREGCRLLKGHVLEGQPLEEAYEQDVNSPDNLDAIAGGGYWRGIIDEYYKDRDLHAAEKALVAAYVERLKQVFNHVIQFPVKAKLSHIAKYRMIYGTMHEDGLLLMADNMNKRWSEFRDRVRPQQVLFEVDYPDGHTCDNSLDKDACILGLLDKKIQLGILLARLIDKYGVWLSTSEWKNHLKLMEKSGSILIKRYPPSGISGVAYRGWDHTDRGGYQLYVERNAQWHQTLL